MIDPSECCQVATTHNYKLLLLDRLVPQIQGPLIRLVFTIALSRHPKPIMNMSAHNFVVFLLGLYMLQAHVVEAGQGRKLKACLDPFGIFCEGSSSSCPPEGFDAVQDLDIEKYIAAPWYIQEQVRCGLNTIG